MISFYCTLTSKHVDIRLRTYVGIHKTDYIRKSYFKEMIYGSESVFATFF